MRAIPVWLCARWFGGDAGGYDRLCAETRLCRRRQIKTVRCSVFAFACAHRLGGDAGGGDRLVLRDVVTPVAQLHTVLHRMHRRCSMERTLLLIWLMFDTRLSVRRAASRSPAS